MFQNRVDIDGRTLVHRSNSPMTHLVAHQLPDESVVHRIRTAKANGDQLRIADMDADSKVNRGQRKLRPYAWCASEQEAVAARSGLIDCPSDEPFVRIIPCESIEIGE